MLGSTLLWLSERRGVFEFIKRNGFSKKLAARFVAGEALDGAIAAVRSLNANGISASLDLLGESVYDERQAERARDEVIGVLDRISAERLDANVSVKLTQMGLDIDSDVCGRNMRDVLSTARGHGIFVRIDMEGSTYTGRTLKLFSERLHPEFGDLTGVVIQSYMRRSAGDVDELIEMQARVRLCKGAYAEPNEIAFQARSEVSQSFTTLLERLIECGNYPGIATHDDALIDHALAFVERKQIPPERFEFQMLYGVRRDLQERLRRKGFNMRVVCTVWDPVVSVPDASVGRTARQHCLHHDEHLEGSQVIQMSTDAFLGGYFEKHERPPAFEGSDGASYSVDVYIEEDETSAKRFAAALLFVKWSADGAQPVGHLETPYLAYADRRSEVRATLYELPLHEVKEHLDRLIEVKKEIPDW